MIPIKSQFFTGSNANSYMIHFSGMEPHWINCQIERNFTNSNLLEGTSV